MSGTSKAAKMVAAKHLAEDPDYYRRIGSLGGKASNGKNGFKYSGKASEAGKIGGAKSRRKPAAYYKLLTIPPVLVSAPEPKPWYRRWFL